MGVQGLWNNLSGIPLGIFAGVGLLDHMADLCSDFQEDSKFFFRVVAQLAFPPAVYEGFLFPHILTNTCWWWCF
jgi:hypothetical protein